MNDLTKPNGAGTELAMPDDYAARLTAGIAESRATTRIAGGGKDFLRLLKSGDWVYGAESIEVQQGSHWAVNPLTLAHGFCCWIDTGNKNELAGEVMVSMTEHKPPPPAPINGTPYTEQRSFDLRCLDGEDASKEVVYKTNSIGGMRAVDGLLAAIQKRLVQPDGRKYPCPVLQLGSDYYDNKKYGRIYTPVLTITGWCDFYGNFPGAAAQTLTDGGVAAQAPAQAAPPAPAPAPEKPKRQRRAPVAQPAENAPPPSAAASATPPAIEQPAPAPTHRQHAGQRRRPVATA